MSPERLLRPATHRPEPVHRGRASTAPDRSDRHRGQMGFPLTLRGVGRGLRQTRHNPLTTTSPEFVESIDDEARRHDAKLLIELMTTVTGEPPVLWGTIDRRLR